MLLPSAVVIVVYLLIGIVAFWPVYPGISRHLFGYAADFTQTVWFLDWVPHALAHGLNPFFSNAIYVPTGVNLAQNTSTPLLGLITAPFAPVFSPVVQSEPADGAGHADLGDRRIRGVAEVAGVGPGGRARWAGLWLLAVSWWARASAIWSLYSFHCRRSSC